AGPGVEDADQHDVADPDGADEQGDRPEPEEEAVQSALRLRARGERGRRLADLDLVRRGRIGRGREHRLDGLDLARVRADVDGGRVTVEGEEALGGAEADEDGAVDLGREGGGREDAGEVEPLPAEPDPFPRVDAVD